ncbi:MAG TPA: tetratricopeptide repeat protein [Candidatus Acidoferrales bacterium]|nr:tetratricopeptide repeat protein [Candidatus Acidoferrales bacterium]
MTFRRGKEVAPTLLVLSALVCAGARPAHAAVADSSRVRRATATPAPPELAYARALIEQRHSGEAGVIACLEDADFRTPAFANADRAAFLLGRAYLVRGDRIRFHALATAVGAWPAKSAFVAWLVERDALESPGAASAGAATAAAARADAARLHAAGEAIARGADPAPILAELPATSRYRARAEHVLALAEIERGDEAHGIARLDSLLAADSSYSARREAGLALAGDALDHERWSDALERYRAVDVDWRRQHDALEGLLSAGATEAIWRAWAGAPDSSSLAPRVLANSDRAGDALARGLGAAIAAPSQPGASATWPASWIEPPSLERWDAVERSAGALVAARDSLERTRAALEDERARLADRRRYFGLGLGRARSEEAGLVPRSEWLDSLRGRIDDIDARLRAVRDGEAHRVAARTAAIRAQSAQAQLWLSGMQSLDVAGPDSSRQGNSPDGSPGPAAVVASEQQLAARIDELAARLAAGTPALLERSYEQAWGPKLIDRAVAQAAELHQDLRWARTLEGSIDGSLLAASGSAAERSLEARVTAFARAADSLALADATLRARVAHEAVQHTLAGLEREREGIDYGLAASAWALAVKPGAADSSAGATAVAQGAGAYAPHADDASEDPEVTRLRSGAMPLLEAFLAQHPHSPARAEMRFRLADLELAAAHQQFRERMADYLRRQAGGAPAGAVPVIEPGRALALYRAILAEDPDFPHLDAVRFDAGMILADQGDPGARACFADLVARQPDSPYAQESWLRMGDMAFDDKRFPESAELYGRAAAGADPTLQAIALYKLGWSHFNQDAFAPAADAFRRLLDLYAAHAPGEIRVELASEAEAYLVHSLAGAGGAPAFAAMFDSLGARPYERRVLTALGQQFRRYDQYDSAIATDELFLARYAHAPEALEVAERLIDTHARANRPDAQREARLALAPRFAPDGEWTRAQTSDSLRTAGEVFARNAWMAEALAHHRRARESGAREDWAEALRLYELVLAHWPKDDGSAALELDAGEAASQLRDYPAALRHDESAVRLGPDSLSTLALWQEVAVTDAWYESTRGGRTTGSDSLAHAVLAAGDRLLARAPGHPHAADIVWRQGQLALAHGWQDRALADLASLAKRYPDDPRNAPASSQRAELLFGAGRFEEAGPAFEQAAAIAHRFGRDSLERRATRAVPVCAYRRAEAAVAADSLAYAKHAELFEQVATRWPAYEQAPTAQYRAGLAWAKAARPRDAVRAFEALIDHYPKCEYVRDARVQIASVWDAAGEKRPAAEAYLALARSDLADEGAAAAWLRSADLFAAAGDSSRSDSLRLAYLGRWPHDDEAAMTILEALARRELNVIDAAHPISKLLATGPDRRHPRPTSRLAEYLLRGRAHAALVSHDLVAEVRFLQGEEAHGAFAAARLGQPLTKSIPAKKRLLDSLLVRYRRSADLGVALWAHASAYRIGQSLVEFAVALEHADPPADLKGADRRAYQDVLLDQSRAFGVRGEDVWTEMLHRLGPDATGDAWTAQAQGALWQRLGNRFLFHPEVEFPLVDEAARPAPAEGGSR